MRVLWFSVTSSLYTLGQRGHNGGGWISSLQQLIMNDSSIELGVAFEHSDTCFKKSVDKVVYYPINAWGSRKSRIDKMFRVSADEKYIIPHCLKVIEDFKPDVIQIFGSEWCFGLIAEFTTIPVIIHMQGSLPSYYNARFPVGISIWDIIFSKSTSFSRKLILYKAEWIFRNRAYREVRILKACKNFMGRTHWDKSIVSLYNPDAKYYHCEEVIRSSFMTVDRVWSNPPREDMIIASTLSYPLYKGVDLILKTAKILKENTSKDFEWRIFGQYGNPLMEELCRIKAAQVGVRFMGIISQDDLTDELLNANVYVHPSYIDNSPNSICEAQLIGVPIIATNVGGVASLIKDGETGFLVPANDPIMLASKIREVHSDSIMSQKMSYKAREIAIVRHNVESIKSTLLEIYKELAK